jgi:hypothetical protein
MRRALVLIAVSALAACNKPAATSAAASGEIAASAPAPASAAASAPPTHNWAAVNDKQYLYYPKAHLDGGPDATTPTTIRYMGQQSDGAFVVAEVEGGAIVLASCTLPCTEVRLRGQGLDQTVSLGGDSVVKAALDDAIAGQLEVFPLPDKAGPDKTGGKPAAAR